MKPHDILPAGNVLGEGILWDSRRARLWWTDIHGRRLHCFHWSDARLEVLVAPERICSFGFVAGSERFIVAFAGGIALYDARQGAVDQGAIEWIAQPAAIVPGIRFNDGRVDRSGRFWSGSMVEHPDCNARGTLFSVGRGTLRAHLHDVRIANALCTSPDGTRLYFADSPTRTIRVFDLHEPGGDLGPGRVFAITPEGSEPDGATVDADGCIWCAHWGGGCVVRYTPDGRIDRKLPVPASQPTCPCFAGPDLDVLCVTSARDGLSAAQLEAESHAGAVFLYRTGNRGLPEPEYLP